MFGVSPLRQSHFKMSPSDLYCATDTSPQGEAFPTLTVTIIDSDRYNSIARKSKRMRGYLQKQDYYIRIIHARQLP